MYKTAEKKKGRYLHGKSTINTVRKNINKAQSYTRRNNMTRVKHSFDTIIKNNYLRLTPL